MTTNFNDSELSIKYAPGDMHNLQASWASTTTLTVAAGECRDSTDSINMVLPSSVTINTAVVGVNGMDTGALAASTPYYVHLLTDTSNRLSPCAVLSAATTPVMPTVAGVTYDAFRVVDHWITDGSSLLLKGYTYGNTSQRVRRWDTSVATAITAGASQTLASIVLTPGVPPIAGCEAFLEAVFTPAAAGNTCSFTPFGSTATVMQRVTGQVAAVPVSREIRVGCPLNSGVPTALYINSAAVCAVNVLINGYSYTV